MKRVFISAIVALLSIGAYAQTDLTTLQFIDKNGNVVEDGSTITVNETEITGGTLQISSGLYVKNTTNEEQGTGVDFTITQLDNGAPQCCFPTNCIPGTNEVGKNYSTENGGIGANQSLSFQTEWIPTSYGTCTVTFQLKIMEVKEKTIFGTTLPDYDTFKAYGPKITVKFVYSDPTSINGVETGKANPVAYYKPNGQRIDSLQQGLNIVVLSNGKTVKILNK